MQTTAIRLHFYHVRDNIHNFMRENGTDAICDLFEENLLISSCYYECCNNKHRS